MPISYLFIPRHVAANCLIVAASLSLIACSTPRQPVGDTSPARHESAKSGPDLPKVGLRKSMTIGHGTASTPVTAANVSAPVSSIARSSGRNIYFAVSSSELPSSARPILQTVATLYKNEARRQITLIGHTAEHGSTEFSIALGQRRVEAVADELEKLGVPARAIKRISYGSESERNTACNSDDCLQEVRRVEIVLGEG